MNLFLQRGPRAQWDPAIAIVIVIAIVIAIVIVIVIVIAIGHPGPAWAHWVPKGHPGAPRAQMGPWVPETQGPWEGPGAHTGSGDPG